MTPTSLALGYIDFKCEFLVVFPYPGSVWIRQNEETIKYIVLLGKILY